MIETFTALTSLLGVIRIMTYKRGKSNYHALFSLVASLLMTVLFATLVVTIKTGESCWEWSLFIFIIVCVLFKRKGNVSWKK